MFNYVTQESGKIRTSQTLRQQMRKKIIKYRIEIDPNKNREKNESANLRAGSL